MGTRTGKPAQLRREPRHQHAERLPGRAMRELRAVKVMAGKVSHMTAGMGRMKPICCLACRAIPATDISIEA